MPARPARKLTIKDTAQKFGDVPFSDTILTEDTFLPQITQLTTLIETLSAEVIGLSGEYKATADELEGLSGELYSTTIGASGDIWNLSAAIAAIQPTATASNKK